MRKLLVLLIISSLTIGCKVTNKVVKPKQVTVNTKEKSKNGKVVKRRTVTVQRF